MSGRVEIPTPDTKVLTYPIMDPEFYLLELERYTVSTIFLTQPLEPWNDDKGLYLRLGLKSHQPFWKALKNKGIKSVIFCCPPSSTGRFTSPQIYNKIYVYDLFDHLDVLLDVYRGRGIWRAAASEYGAENSLKLPRLVEHRILQYNQVDALYDSEEDDFLRPGGPKSPLGCLLRVVDAEYPVYRIYDPWGQWLSPRFMSEMELTESSVSGDSASTLVSRVIESIDWDQAAAIVPQKRKIDGRWIVASIFDLLYFHTLYYALSKRLWFGEANAYDDIYSSLQGGRSIVSNFVIDFSSVLDEIGTSVKKHLGVDVYAPSLPDPPVEETDPSTPVYEDDESVTRLDEFRQLAEADTDFGEFFNLGDEDE